MLRNIKTVLRTQIRTNFLKTLSSKRYKSNSPSIDKLHSELSGIVGEKNAVSSLAAREHHNHDESHHTGGTPSIVVWPNSVQEVSEVARACYLNAVPMIPFGTGTGLEGGVIPKTESVTVNLTNMDAISDLNIEDFDVRVQPGVTRKALNYEIRNTGLWFPVDPGADASVCGMTATGASGTNAVRYGTMKQNILNLEVVLADGTILNTGGPKRRCRKSSAGYNLTELFIGSEGTLGFITSATVRLHGMPESTLSAVCSFPTVQDAVNTSIQVLQYSIPIARIEFLDNVAIKAVNKFSKLENEIAPTLFLEFHGSEAGAKEQVNQVAEIAAANGGAQFKWAETVEERSKLWQARHDALYALLALKPGTKGYSTDVCVPISQLPTAIEHSLSIVEKYGILCGIVGHVGDGNFHCLLTLDSDNESEVLRAKMAAEEIGKKAIFLGGSCTGEHGIGIGKRELLKEEVGLETLNVMKGIKNVLDPRNLMNPFKVI
ncbi:putative D-lactate dehydrogenase, mitochondrial [Ciona intestinalis]